LTLFFCGLSARHGSTQRASRVEVEVDLFVDLEFAVATTAICRLRTCDRSDVYTASVVVTDFEDRGCVGGDLSVIATFAGETAAGCTRIVF
jgi:hypothetical protein